MKYHLLNLLLPFLSLRAVAQHRAAPVFRNDSAVYKGMIKGYTPQLGYTTGQLYIDNIITDDQETELITLQADGRFYAKFPMHYAQRVMVEFGDTLFTDVWCEPGKEVVQQFDLAAPDAVAVVTGKLAGINRELSAARHLVHIDRSQLQRQVAHFTPEQYKTWLLKVKDNLLRNLEQYRRKNKLSTLAYLLLKKDIIYANAVDLFDYHANVHPGQKEDTLTPLDSSYYSFLATIPLNDSTAVQSLEYDGFMNRLKFCPLFWGKTQTTDIRTILTYLQPVVHFTPAETAVIRSFDESLPPGPAHDSIQVKRDAFFKQYRALLSDGVEEYTMQQRYQEMKRVLRLPEGPVFDLMRTQDYADYLERSLLPFSEFKRMQIKKQIRHPFLATTLYGYSEQVKQRIAANKHNKDYQVHDVPPGRPDSIFSAILQKYPGKVVYVDFWATWCAPCRQDMIRMAPVKEALRNENIAFVYITDPSSPADTYANMVTEIKGEHYRVSTDEWNILSAAFKIGGIPHQVLVNKRGEVVDPHMGWQETDSLQARLQQLIKED
jgi:thiol-disulfide isomerase/thioredoxin